MPGVKDSEGSESRLAATSDDPTDLKSLLRTSQNASKEQVERERELEPSLPQLAPPTFHDENLGAYLKAAVREYAAALGNIWITDFERVVSFLFLTSEEGRIVLGRAQCDHPGHAGIPCGETIGDSALFSGHHYVYRNASANEGLGPMRPWARSRGIGTVLAVPAVFRGISIGFVELCFRHDRSFHPAELALAGRLGEAVGEEIHAREIALALQWSSPLFSLGEGEQRASQEESSVRRALDREVTRRRRSLAALYLSRERLDKAQQIAKIGSWEWDARAKRMRWSRQMERIFQARAEDFQGPEHFARSMIHPEDAERFLQQRQRCLSEGLAESIEYRIIRPDGEVRVINGTGEPIFDGLGGTIKVVGTAQDITELKRAEQKSQVQSQTLIDTLASLARDPDLEHCLGAVLSAVAGQLGERSAGLWRWDEGDDWVRLRVNIEGGRLRMVDVRCDVGDGDGLEELVQKLCRKEVVLHGPDAIDRIGAYTPHRAYFRRRGIRSVLYLPVLGVNALMGAIAVRSSSRGSFRNDELERAQALADQAALAMQFGSLAEKARDAAVLQERNRLAREIHDTLAQGFTAIVMLSEAAEESISRGQDRSLDYLGRIKRLARESLGEARRSVQALRPQALDGRSLVASLRETAIQKALSDRVDYDLRVQGRPIELSDELEYEVLRVAQEAVTNALKHARADRIQVELGYFEDRLELSVSDDGVGMPPESADREGFGLTGMRERCQRTGAALTIQGRPRRGTLVRAVFPIARKRES